MIGWTMVWTADLPRGMAGWPNAVTGWYLLPYIAERSELESRHGDAWWWKQCTNNDEMDKLRTLMIDWVHWEKANCDYFAQGGNPQGVRGLPA